MTQSKNTVSVIESMFVAPINAAPGWYVLIGGATYEAVMSGEAVALATSEAKANGFRGRDGNKPDSAGFPATGWGAPYTRAFWFWVREGA